MDGRTLIHEYARQAQSLGLKVDVHGDGNFNAVVAIVGEAPGEREVALRMPMVGGAGQVLWGALKPYGLSRTQCYVTNVIKRQVSLSSKTDARDPVENDEFAMWAQLLEWELAQLPNLRYVLVLGNAAAKAVCRVTGISKWRGSVIKTDKYTCVLSLNPVMPLREPKTEVMFKFDMHKLHLVMQNKYIEMKVNPIINPSVNEALDWIKELHNEKLPISLDIETIGNETACVGLSNRDDTGMCINFRDAVGHRYSLHDEVRIRRALQSLVGDTTTRIVAQNGSFDSSWLWYKDRIRIHSLWFDTLLAHHTLYPTLPHSLAFLTTQYTTHPFYKDEKDKWRESVQGDAINDFWRYNVKDVCITLACQKALQQELEQQKLDKFFYEHVMRLQPHLVKMTVLGVLCDQVYKKKLKELLTEDMRQIDQEFVKAVQLATNDPDYFPSLHSPMQLKELFFKRLKLVGRGTTTDATNRAEMLKNPRTSDAAKMVIHAVDRGKTTHKLLSVYADMEIDPDGRIRCEYKQYGTQSAPGRLSSAAVLWGSGSNLQNQPEKAQQMFVADPGHAFVYFDLSQAEARVVAYGWNVKGLIENFEMASKQKDFDVHRANAARIFRKSYDDIPKEDRIDGKPTHRFLGKRCVHGLNYRMLAPKLAEVCQIPLWQAEEARRSYFIAFPEIERAWNATIAEVRENGYITSYMGRRLLIMERTTDEALDSIIAFRPQSTVGDAVCRTMYLAESDPEWPKTARLSLNIHDAVIAQCLIEDAPLVARILKRHAETPIHINGHNVVIPADIKISQPDEQGVHRWTTLKKVSLVSLQS